MKAYEIPAMELSYFETEDIVTVSDNGQGEIGDDDE